MTRGIAAVDDVFAKKGEEAVLIGYLTTGFPDEKRFLECVDAAFDSGVDILEMGVPFSDPVADGPMIQNSTMRALNNGVNLSRTLDLVEKIRVKHSKPILLMSYFNPIYVFGFERFLACAGDSGVDGAIIPDLQLDEAEEYRAAAFAEGKALVFLASSNGLKARLRQAFENTTGFLYALALEGVTGERESLNPKALAFLDTVGIVRDELKSSGAKVPPIAVGFGVSKREHFVELSRRAEGVIVGSALVRRAAESPAALGRFIRELKGNA